jgi:C1A family cysteine protease
MSQDELMDLQHAIEDSGHDWRAGFTSLTALSPEEQDRRLGLRLVPEEMDRIAAMMIEVAPLAVELPPSWDWRNVDGANWSTPIRDQKACGACVAFGAVAMLEAMLKLHQEDAALQPDLSEAHLFFCGCGNCCDKGWWPSYALDYARDAGVPPETCFPYQDHDMPCGDSSADWLEQAVRISGWQEVLDIGARKEWLVSKGPLVGCMAVYRDFFNYAGGVYHHATGDLAGYHAICVVGYSEAEQCWIGKNSWGTGWGESGWFKIGYGQCEIDTTFAMYGVDSIILGPTPPPPPPTPPPPKPAPGCNLWARLIKAIGGS